MDAIDTLGESNFITTVAERQSKHGDSVEQVVGAILFGKAGRLLAGIWIASLDHERSRRFALKEYNDWAKATGRRSMYQYNNLRGDMTKFVALGMIHEYAKDPKGNDTTIWYCRCNSALWDLFLTAEAAIAEADNPNGRRFHTPPPERVERIVDDLRSIHAETAVPGPPPLEPAAPPAAAGPGSELSDESLEGDLAPETVVERAETVVERRVPGPARPEAPAVNVRPRGPGGALQCSRCKTWKAPLLFSARTDRPWLRKSICKACMAEQARIRYLGVDKLEALNGVGLTFVLADTDDVAGLSCLVCGQRFEPGDVVHGEAGLRHEDCATGKDDDEPCGEATPGASRQEASGRKSPGPHRR